MAVSRGLRNNNPGNIRLSATLWQGEVRPSQDKSFCQFKNMAYGYRALIKLLQNYRRLYHCRTIADFIQRWAATIGKQHIRLHHARMSGDASTGKLCARCG